MLLDVASLLRVRTRVKELQLDPPVCRRVENVLLVLELMAKNAMDLLGMNWYQIDPLVSQRWSPHAYFRTLQMVAPKTLK
jgi:hypothetical protein